MNHPERNSFCIHSTNTTVGEEKVKAGFLERGELTQPLILSAYRFTHTSLQAISLHCIQTSCKNCNAYGNPDSALAVLCIITSNVTAIYTFTRKEQPPVCLRSTKSLNCSHIVVNCVGIIVRRSRSASFCPWHASVQGHCDHFS